MRVQRSLVPAIGVALLLLCGCSSPSDPAQGDSPQETQAVLLTMLDEAQESAGGEWERRDSPSPASCSLPRSGDDGVTFSGRRERAGEGLDERQIAAIADLLEAQGFEVGRAEIGPFSNVRGVMPGNEASYILLEAASDFTALSGQAACVPGDVYVELQRVKDELQK